MEWVPILAGSYLAARVASQLFEAESLKAELSIIKEGEDELTKKVQETTTELETITESAEFLKSSLDDMIDIQTMSVVCPCGKNAFDAPVFLNYDNAFTCEVCKSKFKVTLTPDTVIQTESVNISNIFDSLKEKASEV
jgi:SMC interacting uncharacterized protein involved in chromosome segregation